MEIEFVAADAGTPDRTASAIVVFEGGTLAGAAGRADQASGGQIGRALAAGRFTGAKGQILDLLAPAGLNVQRLLLVGAGKAEAFDDLAVEHVAASAFNAVKGSGLTTLRLELPDPAAARSARAGFAVRLAAYRFDRYRTTESADKKPSVSLAQVVSDDAAAARTAFEPMSALADAIAFSRDLVSEPANILYPEEFARRVKALESLGLEVEILGEAQMAELGMGSLLGVGQGSVRESQLAVIRWNGAADKDAQPVAFIGKGVCFDTGGISIKPADGMEDMKWDMGGAAAVAGLMHALAGRKAKVNAVGLLGLVENMPDGNAQRPGDVVTSLSGQTIEVINTDAEGRLVLADVLWYCQDRFKPRFMIDLATLTGAIIIALGHDYAGLFCNNDALAGELLGASLAEGEGLWRMPLPASYEKQIDSMIADMKNVGGRPAGSITAALFLQRFVRNLPWAHLDIASTAWKKPSIVPTIPDGGSGFGVRLLNRLVADRYEG
ncbi:MAG: leucyl aminopeptidase [Phenylobacterium sp.]|uniref:leucyl aminopeptidase n=1 Tax=Phenylobacterium sp. TaxID=1871053 RepID=UPI002736D31C|nr:leucyl aminopeptidase [Phenylobacterium sp.]MDP3173974.1 leucyl aminopeptidase [Phenylobacterium sp.]